MHDDPQDIERQLLLEAVYRRYHYDFRGYAPGSLQRRLEQACTVMGLETLSALQGRILRDPAAFAELLQFLTVQVSDLFRDPPYWIALRRHVVPFLRTFPYARLWVAGCARGEEVDSLVILLHEEGLLERSLIYATDVNPEALRRAESGVYELGRMAQFSRNYLAAGGQASLADYVTTGAGRAMLDKTLRRNVLWSDHDVATDTVFAEVQMVSCRNVLIYFDRALQSRALGLFREALCHRGYLGLGSRETPRYSAPAGSFEEAAPAERLYRRT